jgi:hypothetical protein
MTSNAVKHLGVGGLDPSMISGVGTTFELLLHVLMESNKRRALEKYAFELNLETKQLARPRRWF